MYGRALLPLALLSLAPLALRAQQGAAELSSWPINNPIAVTPIRELGFGTITRGSTSTVASTSISAAAFSIDGDAARDVVITIPSSVTLITMSGAGGSMTAKLQRADVRTNTTDDRMTASNLDASSGAATVSLSADASGNGTTDGLGQLYVWIGGSITAAATQQRGQYLGTFTVSAAYAN